MMSFIEHRTATLLSNHPADENFSFGQVVLMVCIYLYCASQRILFYASCVIALLTDLRSVLIGQVMTLCS